MRRYSIPVISCVMVIGLSLALAGCTSLLNPASTAAETSTVPTVAQIPHESAILSQTATLGHGPGAGNQSVIQDYGLYSIPGSCPLTQVTEQQERQRFPAWWLEGRGVAAGTPIGVFFEGENKVQWQFATPITTTHFTISGTQLDGQSRPLDAAIMLIGGTGPETGATFSSILTFAAAGCWRIHGEAEPHMLTAIVYVYPAACRPQGLREPSGSLAPCRAVSTRATH